MENKKVWLVTGASKGLGLTLVKALLLEGYYVAATSRNADELEKAVGQGYGERFLALSVDINNEQSISGAVAKVVERFGTVDVAVNNAGYALAGSLEEISDNEARANFDINVFGTLNLIRHIMPLMRAQGSGHIFNISSVGGFTGNFPGFGIYCATKFAIHGLSESLAAEVKQFGVKVTVVSPGYFRTSFLTSGSLNVPKSPIAAYQDVRDSQAAHEQDINGNQPGDPQKAVKVLISVANEQEPPLHLFLGEDAFSLANAKMDDVRAELEKWKHYTLSTGF